MSNFLSLPNWLPWWVPFAVLVPALLYLLVFLLMPFSVFGLKGRLDAIEARLDEIQNEIRTLVLRMPESRGLEWTDAPPPIPPVPRSMPERSARPPIPPAPMEAPRRAVAEPGYRPPPRAEQPYRPTAAPADEPDPAGEAVPEAEGEATAPRRRLFRPARPQGREPQPEQRSEPRLDWPR
jgi:hypothetical protein